MPLNKSEETREAFKPKTLCGAGVEAIRVIQAITVKAEGKRSDAHSEILISCKKQKGTCERAVSGNRGGQLSLGREWACRG